MPLQPSRRASNREARSPLTSLSGSFFLALESFLGVLGAWARGCGDSRAEAKVASGTVTQHKKGGGSARRFMWRLAERQPESEGRVLFQIQRMYLKKKKKANFYTFIFKKYD